MYPKANRGAERPDTHLRGPAYSPARMLGVYTLLFALFFITVFSPFWLYGRTFLMLTDGNAQHLSSLTYFKFWVKTIVKSLMRGRLEIPFWSMWIGFGENTLSDGICFRFLYLLSLFFNVDTLDRFLIIRMILRLYCAGLAFLAYGRTRAKNLPDLLLGCMIYLFSGFVLYYGPRYSFFLSMMIELPLLLLGVDRIFEKKWSWLFIFVVFAEGFCGFYLLFMITIPAVVYALFHFFELTPEQRRLSGGFGRIFARHVVQYALGLCLAAPGLLPVILKYFESSRAAADSGLSLLHWDAHIYADYIRGIVDSHQIAYEGFIALPGVALIGTFYILLSRRKRHRLLRGQIILYHVVFLIPLLTMIFSAMAGRRLRWCFVLSFWSSLCAACALSGLRRDDGGEFRACAVAMGVYAALYLIASAWMGEEISLSLVLSLVGFGIFFLATATPWARNRRRLSTVLLFAWLLVELTVKSYEMHSPQYDNVIAEYVDAGRVVAFMSDNAADAMEMTSDDGLFRTDVIVVPRTNRTYQANYGQRNLVNGVSSYYSLLYDSIASTSLALGNAHQPSNHAVRDLDQRAALDALAGVKYATALEDGLYRVPYGYDLLDSREKRLSDGTVTTEYLYQNQYALPLSYAYTARVSPETYDALPPNRKEQAMLQGVVLEKDTGLPEASLSFDDETILDNDAIIAALVAKSKEDENLEYADGVLNVKKSNYTFEMPIEPVEGEIYLQFTGLEVQSVDYNAEKADELARNGATRLEVLNARRRARQWEPSVNTLITASTGSLSDEGKPYGPDHYLYIGKRDMLLNLGYGETGKKLKIKFSAAGKYAFDSVSLIRQPMDAYPEKIRRLQANPARSVLIDGNRVTVEYDLKEDAFACLAIPYSRDWSVTIDGESAELLRANGMYMGVMLTSGPHTIVYTCTMLGFWPGVVIALIALAVLICVAIFRRTRKNGASRVQRRRLRIEN